MTLPKCVCGDNKDVCIECIENEFERLEQENKRLQTAINCPECKGTGTTTMLRFGVIGLTYCPKCFEIRKEIMEKNKL